jgi:hypothetical protein
MANSYLSSLNITTPDYLNTSPTLLPTPDGAYIISQLRKDTSSQLTSCVISLAHPQAYAMLTTIETPIKIIPPTTITIEGSHHQPIVHIQLNPHNKSILGRKYLGLFQNPLTQTMNPTITMPTVHPTKGLTCRKSAKMSWVVLLLQDPQTLQTYEEYAKESFYEAEGDQPPLPTPLPAGTSTRKPRIFARGELHKRTGTRRGPLQGPPAWTLTMTPRGEGPLRAHPSTKASHPKRP